MYDPLQFGKRELRTPDLGLRRSKNVSFPVIYTGIADLNFESEPNVSDAEGSQGFWIRCPLMVIYISWFKLTCIIITNSKGWDPSRTFPDRIEPYVAKHINTLSTFWLTWIESSSKLFWPPVVRHPSVCKRFPSFTLL